MKYLKNFESLTYKQTQLDEDISNIVVIPLKDDYNDVVDTKSLYYKDYIKIELSFKSEWFFNTIMNSIIIDIENDELNKSCTQEVIDKINEITKEVETLLNGYKYDIEKTDSKDWTKSFAIITIFK